MSGEPESKRRAAQRLLIIAEHMVTRFDAETDEILGVWGLSSDIAAIRIIIDRLEPEADRHARR